MATKGKIVKGTLIGASVIGAGVLAFNLLGRDQEGTGGGTPETPRTEHIEPGFYKTTRAADVFSSPGHILQSVEPGTCFEVVQNMAGYEYAGVRYPADTATGYASGYVKKADIEQNSGCASLAREFSTRAESYVSPESKYGQAAGTQGYILNNRTFIFPNAGGGAQSFTAELPAGTCVRLDVENRVEQVMKVTAKVNGQVVTGWGRTAIDYGRPCTPEL